MLGGFLASCTEIESPSGENSTTPKIEVKIKPKQRALTKNESNLKDKWLELANGEAMKGKEHLSKEELQKEMALYILEDCKQILLDNGYTTDDFTSLFNDDYKLIILEAMKYYSNQNKLRKYEKIYFYIQYVFICVFFGLCGACMHTEFKQHRKFYYAGWLMRIFIWG